MAMCVLTKGGGYVERIKFYLSKKWEQLTEKLCSALSFGPG